MQPRFSSPSVAPSRSLSRLVDSGVDSATCQIHAAACTYKLNSECLQTEFEFINRSSNFRTSFNKPKSSTHVNRPIGRAGIGSVFFCRIFHRCEACPELDNKWINTLFAK